MEALLKHWVILPILLPLATLNVLVTAIVLVVT